MEEALSQQEIHQLGMNYIGKQLEVLGFEFLGVNSDKSKNPQFACIDKLNKLYFVLVNTVVYPENVVWTDEKLLERMKSHAKEKNAKLWVANVGIANEILEDKITQNSNYILKFEGFNKNL